VARRHQLEPPVPGEQAEALAEPPPLAKPLVLEVREA
jgi:hypothetical protein